MHQTLPRLLIALAFATPLAYGASNQDITARHFASLVSGAQPKAAELSLFFTQMPKGGDLHHHYSGAIYAEQYLAWMDKQGYCVNKSTYQIVTEQAVIDGERAKPAAQRSCVNSQELIADNAAYRELLQKWSVKDFYNHGAVQPPPDRAFFDTFGYFNAVASTNTYDGLSTLKQRAIAENLSYIETVFEIAPITMDAAFDQAVRNDAGLPQQLDAYLQRLQANPSFEQGIQAYLANVEASSAGIDDEQFTMRYQPFVLRLLPPSMVFSQMAASFKLAMSNPKIVAVNIVGAENNHVSMRDYALHMQMFKFLKAKYPQVKLSLHAGELAMGMVPPEGLKFHIGDAIKVAGAQRIGHGIDIASESEALDVLRTMRERKIAVEVNLTSNDFILGVKGEAHPITIYRKYGVPFVLATDDAGVTRHTLSNEYVLFASRYKTTYAEVKKLSYDSIRYGFLADADKSRLLRQLDTRFAKFEADVAASLQKANK
jgi:adenosine deaminase/adenosine deaminase CECR1